MPLYPYIYVNADGTARELHAGERAYLEMEFKGGDGAMPYIKTATRNATAGARSTAFSSARRCRPERRLRTLLPRIRAAHSAGKISWSGYAARASK